MLTNDLLARAAGPSALLLLLRDPRPTHASVHSVLSRGPEMNEVTSLGISGTTITIANNEEGRRQEEEGRVSLISQLFMVGSKEREEEGRTFMMECDKTALQI